MKLTVIFLTFLALYLCERVYAPPPPVGRGYVYVIGETVNGLFTTRYFKVGGTGEGNPNTRRGNLNTGNPRHLEVVYYVPVTRTQDAENAAKLALQGWGVNQGGGTEWFYVPANQWQQFSNTFTNAIQNYVVNNGNK